MTYILIVIVNQEKVQAAMKKKTKTNKTIYLSKRIAIRETLSESNPNCLLRTKKGRIKKDKNHTM